jgi:signal transduction histidine kinase
VIRSTQRQVAALVVVSVMLAHAIVIAVVVALHFGEDPALHFPERTALRIVADFYTSQPALRTSLLRDAAGAGLAVREIPESLVRTCALKPAPAECARNSDLLEMPRVRATPGIWLGVAPGGHPPFGHPRGWTRFLATIALIGLPTLALSLWVSRGITAPLRRLTAQAEHVDTETATAPLPVEGTTEIRLLAEAFNRLIVRLTRYAGDQRRMLAAVSHDLRTPLTRLRLRAETIAEPAVREKMVHDITMMQLLIDSALALLQVQDAAPLRQRVDLAALLMSVADEMSDAGTAVKLGGLSNVTVSCDPAMLTRAVENLLENAAKYGGGGTLRLAQADGEAVIEVADTGPGLNDADKAQAFEPWFRANGAREGQGSGLGLAIVQAVMRTQGGRVELSDASPHGLVARLILPL